MLKLDHKVVIGYTTINVIGVTTVFVKYPFIFGSAPRGELGAIDEKECFQV